MVNLLQKEIFDKPRSYIHDLFPAARSELLCLSQGHQNVILINTLCPLWDKILNHSYNFLIFFINDSRCDDKVRWASAKGGKSSCAPPPQASQKPTVPLFPCMRQKEPERGWQCLNRQHSQGSIPVSRRVTSSELRRSTRHPPEALDRNTLTCRKWTVSAFNSEN